MPTTARQLAQRIRQIRVRHYGQHGKPSFARALNISLRDYEYFEKSAIPPAQVMVRMCEVTGEDLQWLLTGCAARSTMLISGARTRHQELLAQIAQALEKNPSIAAQLSAFMTLLSSASGGRAARHSKGLPAPRQTRSIPLFSDRDLPTDWQRRLALPSARRSKNPRSRRAAGLLASVEHVPLLSGPAALALVDEPITLELCGAGAKTVGIAIADAGDLPERGVGVRLSSDHMKPFLAKNDIAIVLPDAPPQLGQAALLQFKDKKTAGVCRVWLGEREGIVRVARLSDHRIEEIPRRKILQCAKIIFRIRLAA